MICVSLAQCSPCLVASLCHFSISKFGSLPLFRRLFLEHSNDIIVMSLTIFLLSALCNGEALKILAWSSEVADVLKHAEKGVELLFFSFPTLQQGAGSWMRRL